MKRKKGFVLDSYAILSFFQAEKGSDEVLRILKQAGAGKVAAYMNAINLGKYFMSPGEGLGTKLPKKCSMILKDSL